MKDRDQKAKALRYAVSKGWFPQLEVDVHPLKALGKKVTLLTDLDVLASTPDDFEGFRVVVFDCKTRADQSAINRALWLRGVLDRMRASQGICILKKHGIELDHKLVASKLGVILLAEDEFDLYATTTSKKYAKEVGHVGDIDLWDKLFGLKDKYVSLGSAVDFSRSIYWMIDDAAVACRKTLATIHEIRGELDPAKDDHISLTLDLASLFSRALAVLCAYIFNTYLHPKQQTELEGAVRVLLYGGREAYEHRNQLYRMLKESKGSEIGDSDLTLPEWPRFIQLVRQVLDAPIEAAHSPLILREVAFKYLANSDDNTYAKELCAKSPQAGRFAVLTVGYLFKAAKLPSEFLEKAESTLLPLLEK